MSVEELHIIGILDESEASGSIKADELKYFIISPFILFSIGPFLMTIYMYLHHLISSFI